MSDNGSPSMGAPAAIPEITPKDAAFLWSVLTNSEIVNTGWSEVATETHYASAESAHARFRLVQKKYSSLADGSSVTTPAKPRAKKTAGARTTASKVAKTPTPRKKKVSQAQILAVEKAARELEAIADPALAENHDDDMADGEYEVVEEHF